MSATLAHLDPPAVRALLARVAALEALGPVSPLTVWEVCALRAEAGEERARWRAGRGAKKDVDMMSGRG